MKGTIACQQTGGRAQVSRGDAPWDPRDMAKATLPKPQSPEDARHRPPERHPIPAPRPATTSLFCRRNLRSAERCPMRAIKEMSGAPKSRSDVQQRRTRDQPSGREPQGDGVPIVVVRITPHQGGRESRPHGDMLRATYRPLCCGQNYVALGSNVGAVARARACRRNIFWGLLQDPWVVSPARE